MELNGSPGLFNKDETRSSKVADQANALILYLGKLRPRERRDLPKVIVEGSPEARSLLDSSDQQIT